MHFIITPLLPFFSPALSFQPFQNTSSHTRTPPPCSHLHLPPFLSFIPFQAPPPVGRSVRVTCPGHGGLPQRTESSLPSCSGPCAEWTRCCPTSWLLQCRPCLQAPRRQPAAGGIKPPKSAPPPLCRNHTAERRD